MWCLPWALSLTSFSRTLTISHRENKLGLQYPWLALGLNISIGPLFVFICHFYHWPYVLPLLFCPYFSVYTHLNHKIHRQCFDSSRKSHSPISPAKENTCKHYQKTSQARTNNRLHDINKNSPRQRRQKLGRRNLCPYL